MGDIRKKESLRSQTSAEVVGYEQVQAHGSTYTVGTAVVGHAATTACVRGEGVCVWRIAVGCDDVCVRTHQPSLALQAYRIEVRQGWSKYSILRRFNDFRALHTSVRVVMFPCWCPRAASLPPSLAPSPARCVHGIS